MISALVLALWLPLTSAADVWNGHTATLDPAMPGVTYSASGATFNEHGRLVVAASPRLSPGGRDFAFGVTVTTTDTYANLFQAGTMRPGQGFLKVELAGSWKNGRQYGIARCRFTGLKASVMVNGGPVVADGIPHVLRCSRTGAEVALAVDGVTVAHRRVDVGAVIVSERPWTLGAKAGTDIGPSDALNGTLRDAWLSIEPRQRATGLVRSAAGL